MAEEEEQQEEQEDKNKRIRLRERACGQKNILTIDSAHQIFIPSYGPLQSWLALYPIYSHLSNKRDVMLTNFEVFHPAQIKNPPYTFMDFLDFSTLHSTFIRFMY